MEMKNLKVFDEMLDGVQVLAADLTYAYLNVAARHQLGLGPSVSIGTDFRAVCQEQGWEVLLHLAETCLKNQTAGRKALTFPLPDGSYHQVVFRLQPLPPGLMITSVTIEHNTTSDWQMAGSSPKSTSLPINSHELNTPLASIQLSLDVLEKYNTDEHQVERERYHEHIRNEAQNMRDMLKRIKKENPGVDREKYLKKNKVDVKLFAVEIACELGLLTEKGPQIQAMDDQGTNVFTPEKRSTYLELENKIIELKETQINTAINKDNRYRSLFDSMTEMMQVLELIYDAKGRPIDFYIREANMSFTKFVGKTKRQLINKKSSSVFGVIEESWLTAFASVDKTGEPTSFENYGVEFDKYYYVTAWKIAGNRVGVLYTDITDERRSSKNKHESKIKLDKVEKELNKAQKLAQVGSWIFNPLNEKSEWSDEMFYIWGFEPKNGMPKHDAVIKRIHTDDFELYDNSVARASSLGTPYDIEFRICIPKGEDKTLRAICQPVLEGLGKVVSLTVTNQDITAQKSFEESLVKHERLKAIGEMSSSIAHDFNNSLQGMIGNLEVAKLQTDLSGSTLERLNNIGSIVADVADRISILQRFGDTEYNNEKFEIVDMNKLISETLEQSRPLWKDDIEKKGLEINTIINFGDIPGIRCNSGELKSAIYNLIKNSVEAMPRGGDITIETGIKGGGVFTTFTDTGSGMSEETQLKIFEPFYTTKGFKPGRGIGMSGVYSVVKRNKGDITVISSELGKGTTIELFFPIGHQDKIKDISEKESEQIGKELICALWVDDDNTIRECASALVELIGHRCDNVNSGHRALEYLNESTYDIVFTDIGMPNMNGWELAAAIRNKFGGKIKIAVVTGWNIDEETKNEYDVDFVIQKPFTVEDLKKVFMSI